MPVITDVSTSVEALQFLVEEADYRIQHNRHAPLILVLIDRLELLLHGDAQTTRRLLTQLLKGLMRISMSLLRHAAPAPICWTIC